MVHGVLPGVETFVLLVLLQSALGKLLLLFGFS